MSDARNNILARLQRGRREPVATPAHAVTDTDNTPPVDRFIQGLAKVTATHRFVDSAAQLTRAVEDYLQDIGGGSDLVVANAITGTGLLQNHSFQIQAAPTRGNEKNVLTLAYAGIAETGSLVMSSGADTPMTSNFLPDNFICVLYTRDVLDNMEALWARMKEQQRPMPRSLTLVTGPSRTADVEQTLQMGAHGPRRVHVILWDDSG